MKQKLRLGDSYALTNHKLKQYTIRYLSLLAVVMIMCLYARAQQQETFAVSGKVISAASGAAIEGVTVTNKRTKLHTFTGREGDYNIPAQPDDILIYTFVGYVAAEEEIGGRERIIVGLDLADGMLEEVVINTGYQYIPKERSTGSFVYLDSALVNRAVSTDIISRLKGVAPSLLFDERAGGEPKLSIRGRSTIYGNASPLIVVDNFPYEGDLRNINPNDVENISILRDASAASIWGIRAGNGVIVITTKQGREGLPLQVRFNANATLTGKPDMWYHPAVSASDFLSIERFLFQQGHYNGDLANNTTFPVVSPAVEIMADTSLTDMGLENQLSALATSDIRRDIDKYFYRPALLQQYALSARGSGNRHRFSYAAGFDNNRDNTVANGYSRVSLSAQHQFDFSERLQVRAKVAFTQSHRASDNTLSFLTDAYPYERLIDDDGNHLPIVRDYRQRFTEATPGGGRLDWRFVPLDEPGNRSNVLRLNHYLANLHASYRIIQGMRLQLFYQYEGQVTQRNDLFSEDAYYVRDMINSMTFISDGTPQYPVPLGGIFDHYDSRSTTHNGRVQLDYGKRWGLHDLNVLAGAEAREALHSGFANRFYGYDHHTGTSLPVNYLVLYRQYPENNLAEISRLQEVSGSTGRFRSYYTNGAYTYKGRYTISASARIDQTNLFGVNANQRTIPLWSAGFKWDVHTDIFYRSNFVDELSLRWSFGYNGNFDETATAFVTSSYYSTGYGTRAARINSLPNPDLRGERSAISNIGLDFAVADNRIAGRIEYYHRNSKDLINNVPIDPTTGMASFRGNVAHMKGRGWDLELNGDIVRGKRFQWAANIFWSFTRDKVTKSSAIPDRSYFFADASLSGLTFQVNPLEGYPLFGVYSYPWAGLDQQTGDPLGYLAGKPSNDYAAIQRAVTVDSLIFHGRAQPAHIAAFRQTFRLGALSLSVNVAFKGGYYFRRQATMISYVPFAAANTADFAIRWQQPGDERFTQVPALVYPADAGRQSFYEGAEVLVEKGDHIRLQDVQLTYDFAFDRFLGGRFSTLQCYAYANHLGIIWRANNHRIDPDYNGNSNLGFTSLPAPRSIALGIRATF